MTELFEAFMVLCFGISWPISVMKSYRARTAKGKSIFFMLLIWVGYIFGITGKLCAANITYVFFFYIFNIVAVSTDILLYIRNYSLDKKKAA